MKKIGFIGSQGTGKTTMAYEVATELKKMGLDVSVLSEVARSCPLPINEDATREAQLWIMGKQITREQSSRNSIVITDRTLLDVYCYSINTDPNFFEKFEGMIKEYMKTYNLIFYLVPNNAFLVDDGTRSTDIDFRNRIDELMKGYLSKLDIDGIKVNSADVNTVIKICKTIL